MANFVTSVTLQFKDAFSAGFASAQNSMAGMRSALGELGKSKDMVNLAGDLSRMSDSFSQFSGKISAVVNQPSQLAGGFESAMKNVAAISGRSADEMATLNKQVLALGANSNAGPQAAADAMSDIAGGVDNAAAHIPMLTAAIKLAEAGQADLGTSANGLVSIMNAYGMTTGTVAEIQERAAKTSDILTQTVGAGVGSMEQFVGAMSQITGLSSSVGVDLQEVGTAMAFITTKGPTASIAATELRAAETALLNPNTVLAKALQQMGIESGSAMLKQNGLVGSLKLVQQALGGSQDAIAKALGSTEALNGANYLLGDGYQAFSNKFSSALQNNVTAEAQATQNQSYESKLKRMQSASQVLQIEIGDNVNAIKGHFADVGTFFLDHVAMPIMNSPLGGAFQNITAAVGTLAPPLIGVASHALTTATQIINLSTALESAGGMAKVLGSAMSLASAPFVKLKSGIAALLAPLITHISTTFTATAAQWGFTAALYSTALPIVAVIAGIALLAVGAVELVKHWSSVKAFFSSLWSGITGAFNKAIGFIKNLFAGMPNVVKGALAFMFPIISIPVLIVQHWETIKGFFVGLWSGVVSAFQSAWTGITEFFSSLWNGIVGIVATVANWFSGVWDTVSGVFTAVWTRVYNFFASIWDSVKGVVLGFVQWLSPVIDKIIAPFKAVGKVIGSILDTVGGWFGTGSKNTESAVDKIASSTAGSAAPKTPVVAAAAKVAPIVKPSLKVTAPKARSAAGASEDDGGWAQYQEDVLAARGKSIASTTMNNAASEAFASAGAAAIPELDIPSSESEDPISSAADTFTSAGTTFSNTVNTFADAVNKIASPASAKRASGQIVIEHLELHADDVLDFVRQLQQAVFQPEEAVA